VAAVFGPGGAGAINASGSPVNPRQVLTTRLARQSLENIAKAIGKDDTAACKIRANERPCTLTEFCALLELAGLKLVDAGRFCVRPTSSSSCGR
jgi:hypothetical protein